MADFKFGLLTHSPDVKDVISSALGDTADNKFRSAEDFGKAVKMGAKSNHILCATGDEIEGFIDSVRGDTVNDGYSFGGVARGGRFPAKIGPNQGATAAAVLDLVVADDQAEAGTKGDALVRTGEPTKKLWRIISMSGDGTEGTSVVLEKV